MQDRFSFWKPAYWGRIVHRQREDFLVTSFKKLMAFRVRKCHSLLLGLIGLCLVAYSSYFSSPGLLFLESTDADVGGQYSAQNGLLKTGDSVSPVNNIDIDVNKVSGKDMPEVLSVKVHAAVTTFKGKNILNAQSASDDGFHGAISMTGDQGVDAAIGLENITVNSSTHQVGVQHPAESNHMPQPQSHAPGTGVGGLGHLVNEPVSPPEPALTAPQPQVQLSPASQSLPHGLEPAAGEQAQGLALSSASASDAAGKAILTYKIYEPEFDAFSEQLCPNMGDEIELLIIVTSAPNHKEARMAIRYTWGSFRQRKDVSIGFLVGSVSDVHKQELLDIESDTYNDIIRAKFLDSYNNLTLKTISLLEWVDTYCSRARFILKTDDDMFINVPRLRAFTEKHNSDKRAIFGRLAKKWKPIRNKASKYYVSLDQYKPPIFPDFTTGPAYLLTSDIVHDMYRTALNKTYLKLEDVFLTGIVAQEMKVKRIHVSEFLNKRISLNACSIQKGISIHMIKYPEQFDLWKKLLDGKSKCS